MLAVKNWFIAAVCLVGLTASDDARAQRDSPVWDCYLSPIEVHPKRSDVSVEFTLHKVGGPHEHTEHQCYLLLYRKAAEDEILQVIRDPEEVAKDRREHSFLDTLRERKLIVELGSNVANRRDDCDRARCFEFGFELLGKDMVAQRETLADFDVGNTDVAGNWAWHKDELGLIAFVPVNDSVYSTKVKQELRQTHDFGRVMNSKSSILYFKPLPYNLTLRTKGTDVTVHIH